VLSLHADQIRRYGGRDGIRDVGLLSAAVAVPAATFAGRYLHHTLADMAAAYLFHLAQDHAFVDGNKRVALAAALTFLWLNGVRIEAGEDELTEIVLGVATGRVGKAELAVFFTQHMVGGRPPRGRGR
jgi:death-on-curing protein